MDILLQNEIDQVRVIEGARKYWFIRTYGGETYESFLEFKYIGLGLNSIPYQYIVEANKKDLNSYNRLHTYLINNLDYTKAEATKWANQIISFEKEIKIDDIVLAPSKNSDYIAIGLIESDTYVQKVTQTFTFDDKKGRISREKKACKMAKSYSQR